MGRELPRWALRIRRERELRGWSQSDAVRALQSHASGSTVGVDALLRRWKAWEAGDNHPDEPCYRFVGEDAVAEHLADEVLRTMPNAPMRRAEARVTLGVVAARRVTSNKPSITAPKHSKASGSPYPNFYSYRVSSPAFSLHAGPLLRPLGSTSIESVPYASELPYNW